MGVASDGSPRRGGCGNPWETLGTLYNIRVGSNKNNVFRVLRLSLNGRSLVLVISSPRESESRIGYGL